ncbi:hypothetical protein JCM5350_000265 [Sporobolomyces pararoseus]
MYWKKYTREKAAQQLLNISHRLSDEAFIFRPIEDSLVDQFSQELETTRGELIELGYPEDCTTLKHISSVLSTLQNLEPAPAKDSARLSFNKALDLAPTLIRAAQSLSTSASPFPIPNRHLPPEILHLIYNHVAEKEDHVERQRTVNALASTSISWRQIVVERPIVYLPTLTAIEKYCDSAPLFSAAELRQPWEELHVDLSGYSEDEDGNRPLWDALTVFKYVEPLRYQGKVVLSIKGAEINDPKDCEDLKRIFSHKWSCTSLRIQEMNGSEYGWLALVLHTGETDRRQDKEYFIGHSEESFRLDPELTQSILDGGFRVFGAGGFFSGVEYTVARITVPPIFTDYTVFAAPWLVFTAPIFLLETISNNYKPASLPPSRLRHLELSFQVDPTNPARAIEELESFFSKIAPRIERLAFRLRITDPHPSQFAESTFTAHLVSCLLSCRRLENLEIGGFGFSPDFLARLSVFPLSSLKIGPLQYFTSCEQALQLFEPPSLLRSSLKQFSCPESLSAAFYSLPQECEDAGIEFSWNKTSDKEREMYEDLMETAGIDNDTI